MPLLQLHLTDIVLGDEPRRRLLAGLTRHTAALLGKRAELTVVNITQSSSGNWSLAGTPLEGSGWCASLTIHVTAGTNTPDEQSAFIASACALLREVLEAPPAAPVYVIVDEVAAHSWGYDGRTQLDRRPPPARGASEGPSPLAG